MSSKGDVVELAYRLSNAMRCSLTKDQVVMCVSLLESGVAPEALAHIIKELPVAVNRRRSLRAS